MHITDCVNVLLLREKSPKKLQLRYFGIDGPSSRRFSVAQDDAGLARVLTMKLMRLNTHLHEQEQFMQSLKQNAERRRRSVYQPHLGPDTIEQIVPRIDPDAFLLSPA